MEDYIQGCVCGYLMVQRQDPRPKFDRPVDGTFAFEDITRLHYYAALNPKAPPFSICLTTDKNTDIYIPENHEEMEIWYHAIQDRLEALTTMLKGHLMIRRTLNSDQQMQRFVLNTKFKWKKRFVELGRSSLLYCNESKTKGNTKNKIFKQFPLNPWSYVIEESIEHIRPVIGNISKTVKTKTNSSVKNLLETFQKMSSSSSLTASSSSSSRLHEMETEAKFPFTICTGQIHLVVAAPTRTMRNEWVLAIRLRIVSLKHRQNPFGVATTSTNTSLIQFHGFMEIKEEIGIKWKKRYILLENGMIRIKKNERQVGALIEIPLLPTCTISPTLVKANSFCIKSLGKQVHLAGTTALEAEKWIYHIQQAAKQVSPIRYQKLFEQDLKEILRKSSYMIWKYQPKSCSSQSLVMERFNKRIYVKNHLQVPKGSILIGIKEHGLLHETFENIWHKLRQKKGHRYEMDLFFRLPIQRTGIVQTKENLKQKEGWIVRKMILNHGILSLQNLEFNVDVINKIIWEFPLRNLQFDLISKENAGGMTNCMTISNTLNNQVLWYINVTLEDDFLLWYGILHLENCLARNDPRFPIVLPQTQKELNNNKNKPNRHLKCHFTGKIIAVIEKNAENYRKHIMDQAAKAMLEQTQDQQEQQQQQEEDPVIEVIDPSKSKPKSANGTSIQQQKQQSQLLLLTEQEIKHLFDLFDIAECGKISTMSLQQKLHLLTIHLTNNNNKSVVPWELFKSMPNVTLERFTKIMHEITHPEAIHILRQYGRGEIQCL